MLVYTHAVTERCRYTFDLIFTHILRLEYTLTDSMQQYEEHQQEKLAYTNAPPAGGFYIQCHQLLFEIDIHPVETAVFPFAATSAFFPATAGDFPFDLFAASFYLVTRYEEYLPFRPDRYGRFRATDSLAGRYGFLLSPVVNRWAHELKKLLTAQFPSLHFGADAFRAVVSFDIDIAYAYKGRPFLRQAAAMLKDLIFFKRLNLSTRIRVLTGKATDPYDTYHAMQEMVLRYGTEAIFFFLLARKTSRFDRNLPPSSTAIRQLIGQTGAVYQTGIHPSYYSMEQPRLIDNEKKELEEILGRPVTSSRQHYLRFSLPGTYEQLEAAGITDDYSMGYAETPGFRAGTCTPFVFFNVKKNMPGTLNIYPVAFMEGAFLEDLHMQPGASLDVIRQLVGSVKQVNGTFLCIWHNHTISETGVYTGWKQVLQETLLLLSKQ